MKSLGSFMAAMALSLAAGLGMLLKAAIRDRSNGRQL